MRCWWASGGFPSESRVRSAPWAGEMTGRFKRLVPPFQELMKPQISPLRYAPVEMTILFERHVVASVNCLWFSFGRERLSRRSGGPGGLDSLIGSWPESCEEHRPISIAGVLRLRAVDPLLGDWSARRFAQDDGLVGGLKNIPIRWAKNGKKVTTSQDDGACGGVKKTSQLG
jgi:hypothetical protein